jgi:predicted RND superfamily exporter protein
VTRSIIENVTAGLEEMAALSFGVAFLFLLVVLRSPRDSLVLVLAVPATAATLVLGAMYLLEIPWNPGTVSMASIALGVGIDYGLHVHERYEEVRAAGVAPAEAMQDALQALSRPIVGSGLTTVAGFGVLVFSRFPVVRNFGKTLVLVVACSMFAAFVVLPTVVLALDGRR